MAMILTNQSSSSLLTRPIPSKNCKSTFNPRTLCAERSVTTLMLESRMPLFKLFLHQPYRRLPILLYQNLSVCFPPEFRRALYIHLTYQIRLRVFQRVENYFFHLMCHSDGIRMLHLYNRTLSTRQQDLTISFALVAHCE